MLLRRCPFAVPGCNPLALSERVPTLLGKDSTPLYIHSLSLRFEQGRTNEFAARPGRENVLPSIVSNTTWDDPPPEPPVGMLLLYNISWII